MKNTVIHKLNKLPEQTSTDWKRVDAFTEQQLIENAQQDLETFLADDSFWENFF